MDPTLGLEAFMRAHPEYFGPDAPLYPSAILFPAFAFPSWLLCMAPMIWHFHQTNIAAGSLILWIILANFFNSVNALIWPRDNYEEWWDGAGWCDIHVRLQVGSYVGMTASVALVIRKLAIVMDTNNMTVSTSRKSRMWAKIWEVVWCWVVPGFFIALYYVVQPARYFIYGIVGCISAHDSSWPSVVLGFMWPTIGMLFASYWACLLVYRLYRYRREFHRLVAARNTTSSRFVRLFILSLVVVLVYLSYSIYLLVNTSTWITSPYSWSTVHNPETLKKIWRIPVMGSVSFEKWVQVITGYVTFCLLGTGVDANAHYRRVLVRMGVGKIWPSLHAQSRDTGTPKRSSAARTWTSSVSSKAKSMLWSSKSSSTLAGSTLAESTIADFTKEISTGFTTHDSIALDFIPRLHTATTQDTLLSHQNTALPSTSHISHTPTPTPTSPQPSFFRRYFARPSFHGPLLPLFSHRSIAEMPVWNHSRATDTTQPSSSSSSTVVKPPAGVYARAWAEETCPSSFTTTAGGHVVGNSVHVVREVQMRRDEKGGGECEVEGREMRDWA